MLVFTRHGLFGGSGCVFSRAMVCLGVVDACFHAPWFIWGKWMRVFTRHGLFEGANAPTEDGVECWNALNQKCLRKQDVTNLVICLVGPLIVRGGSAEFVTSQNEAYPGFLPFHAENIWMAFKESTGWYS